MTKLATVGTRAGMRGRAPQKADGDSTMRLLVVSHDAADDLRLLGGHRQRHRRAEGCDHRAVGAGVGARAEVVDRAHPRDDEAPSLGRWRSVSGRSTVVLGETNVDGREDKFDHGFAARHCSRHARGALRSHSLRESTDRGTSGLRRLPRHQRTRRDPPLERGL